MLGLQFGDDLGGLEFAQDVGRPNAMSSAFTYGRIINAHELERRRNRRVWFDQRISKWATLRKGQL
jgi:hypothetical protein